MGIFDFLGSIFGGHSGGGGSSPAPSTSGDSSMAIKNAYIDSRYTAAGANPGVVNPELSQLKSIGYNTVTFGVEVPVNAQTGQIDTSQGRGLPSGLWQEVQYAHSIGLKVYIKAEPCVAFNADGSVNGGDPTIQSTTALGPGVSLGTVFASVAAYEQSIASQAQANGVNGFFIGSSNYGTDSGASAGNWNGVISAVKSVYSGPIGYSAPYNNSVFGMVDIVEFTANPILSGSPMYDVGTIVNQASASGYTGMLQGLANAYAGKTFLIDYSAQAETQGVGTNTTAWTQLLTNPGSLNSAGPNYAQQAASYSAMVQIAHNIGAKGISIGEYDPWAVGQTDPNWIKMDQLGSDLWNNTTVNNALHNAFPVLG